jgi:undecaprenyl-diphosphatase
MKASDPPLKRGEAKQYMRRRYFLLCGIIAPLGIFGSIAEDVAEKEKFFFDQNLLYFARDIRSTSMDRLMAAITHAGSGIALGVLCTVAVLFLLRNREHVAAWFIVTCLTGAAMLNQICKHLFARARPDLWVSALPETSFSFPSGHAMNSMAMCAALVIVTWPGKWRGATLAFSAAFVPLVGASRLYWGVHYPSDIVAGWACAIAWVCAVKYVFDMRVTSSISQRF